MKKISGICILSIMLLLCCWLLIRSNYINKNNYIMEELSYIDVEDNLEVETVLINNEEHYEKISLIDYDVLNMLNVKNTYKLTDEEKLDICMNYISRNIESFSDKIKNINKEFIYEENETQFYAIGYIDKYDLIEIARQFFNINNFDFSSYKFYDKQSDFVAIVPIINESVKYDSSKVIDIKATGDNMYSLKIEYNRSIQDIKNVFLVEYLLNKIDGKYYIIGYNVINSNIS